METADLAVAIGARVRRERGNRAWTLDHLAQKAGVSRRMVVNVEQGATNPSVGTLLKLGDALGVGLPELVQPPQTPAVTITRDGTAATLWRGESGGRGVLVAAASAPDALELWDWTLAPQERHDSEAHTSGTRELIHVHDGTLTLVVGDQTIVLETGDAASFVGDVSHAYANTGTGSVHFALSVFEPNAGTPTQSKGH